VFLLSVSDVYAIQGSCSSHGGVNCDIGQDYDGSVICNDGWRESSVSYYEADECLVCVYPTVSGCKDENDYGVLNIKLTANGGYLGMSTSQQSALNRCRNEIRSFQGLLAEYNSCVERKSQVSNSYSYTTKNYTDSDFGVSFINAEMDKYCVGEHGSQSYFDSNGKRCLCRDGFYLSKGLCVSGTQYCLENFENSFFNQEDDSCLCKKGYVVLNGVCVSAGDYCVENYGVGSWFDENTKECSWCETGGVRGALLNGECVFPESTITSVFERDNIKDGTFSDNVVNSVTTLLPSNNFVEIMADDTSLQGQGGEDVNSLSTKIDIVTVDTSKTENDNSVPQEESFFKKIFNEVGGYFEKITNFFNGALRIFGVNR